MSDSSSGADSFAPKQVSANPDSSYCNRGFLAGTFTRAYVELGNGRAVKLPEWIGYWILNGQQCVEMHLGDGTVKVMEEGQVLASLYSISRDRWYVLSKKDIAAYDTVHRLIREASQHE